MIETTYTCDYCKDKITQSKYYIVDMKYSQSGDLMITLKNKQEFAYNVPGRYDLCSIGCLLRFLSQILNQGGQYATTIEIA